MTPEQFVYWLQGFYEISGNELAPTARDIIIRDHLKEVFRKVTPSYQQNPSPLQQQCKCGTNVLCPLHNAGVIGTQPNSY